MSADLGRFGATWARIEAVLRNGGYDERRVEEWRNAYYIGAQAVFVTMATGEVEDAVALRKEIEAAVDGMQVVNVASRLSKSARESAVEVVTKMRQGL